MIFGVNTTCDISKLSQISRAVTNNNFEISLVVFMPNITTNHAITYTNVQLALLNQQIMNTTQDNLESQFGSI